ncbi:MAG: cysteine desulfurase family protein [Eubacteriales bacterium]|nr:cysteine desulfurase family protein [Eubacteriales bacterium]
MPIYLDNSATTRVCDAAAAAMMQCMQAGYFNPSAVYGPALETEKMMRACRETLLRSVHARTGSQAIFTSGGTEADNLAILGRLSGMRGGGRILYSAGEHPAVKEACLAAEAMGFEAHSVPYDHTGAVDLDALEKLMTPDTRLICCMQVNNETGAIQPLSEIAALRARRAPEAHFHVDGVQGFLRVPFDMPGVQADSYALSGHKIHGPKGIGALILAPGVRVHPRALGGGQESGLRSGTENTPGIAGLLAAVEAYPLENGMRQVKLHLWQRLRETIPDAAVNGPAPDSDLAAPHILNVSLPPVRSETMLHALEGAGIYVGMGSACSSHKQKVSAVLRAMNTPQRLAESALRFSLCPENTLAEMEQVAAACGQNYAVLSKFQRR